MTAKTNITPILIIDTREQNPLNFVHYKAIRATLYAGDYSIQGLETMFSIERKSIDDLCGSLTSDRARFERELHRLRGYQFKRLLIEGTQIEVEQHRYRSRATPQSILGSLATFEIRFDTPIVWAGDREHAAVLIERWAYYFAREIAKLYNGLPGGGS
ncbi:MAG: hypothetical protein EOM20_18055 [Spartobacteria bacterium]|nr:hypothetical protein [Spartobacteria bacterium]